MVRKSLLLSSHIRFGSVVAAADINFFAGPFFASQIWKNKEGAKTTFFSSCHSF